MDIEYCFHSNGVKLQKPECDAILFCDKDITLAKVLEQNGYKVFNNSECIKNCDNKALTYKILADNHIAMPKTFILPLLFFPNTKNNLIFVQKIET